MERETFFKISLVITFVILVGGGFLAWKYWREKKIPAPPTAVECRVDSDCAPCGSGCAPIEISQKDICHVGLQLNECACINNKCVVKELVTIALNKTEYSQGERVSANANFTGKIQVFSEGAWSIYKWNGNSWVKIAESIGCSSYPDCESVNFDEIENCTFPICEAPAWYEIDDSHPYAQWAWNQKQAGGYKSYKCRFKLGVVDQPRIIDHRCIVYKQVPPGKYKIRFEYAKSPDKLFGGKEGKNINYTEKEFTIK
jgi:hypothetical protein